eukprot:TRINITY_DN2764_c0_g2_i1.p1 TRINITY_DN2764_c0_g2~~TRINITY_DN2764_c0_g2_i1.p1  ORF type:complete len:110 (-),score=17.14 TRINITY_DN2764_c0_g2_i1:89-418(-)
MSSDFVNPTGRFDPGALLDDEGGGSGSVHLRIQKRSGRKSLTIIQGIDPKRTEKVLKYLKKTLCCNGSIITTEEFGTVIQLQGDHRESVKDFLISKVKYKEENIKVHGY